MLNVEVIKAGLHSTIQDGGRIGMAFYGIPRSGFMDYASATIANALVGNKKSSSCIEMMHQGMVLRFESDATIAITGGDMQATIDGEQCPMYQTVHISLGATLQFKGCRSGVLTYLAIRGKWKIPKIWGSTSTYTYAQIGGLDGRLLCRGDLLNIEAIREYDVDMKWTSIPDYSAITEVQFHKGPEWNLLDMATDRPDANKNVKVKKSPMGNRMGVELDTALWPIKDIDGFKSQAVIPGMIQCTPMGKLIVILQDGQTTGGYPRVGMISADELCLFNQIKPGIQFTLRLES